MLWHQRFLLIQSGDGDEDGDGAAFVEPKRSGGRIFDYPLEKSVIIDMYL